MRSRGVLLFLSFAALAGACLWDYDTLSIEAKKMPDVVDAIVGRFDRNPPLYYEMRLKRVSGEIEKTPESLNLYDDAAVACDKLGDDDAGLEWLARKHDVLQRVDPDEKRLDDWYRYYANLGTLRVHRWAKNGMKREDIHELEQAIVEIEKAIEINPNAHFGREWVQQGLMWTLHDYITDGPEEAHSTLRGMLAGRERKEIINGLAGLITLGAAWESPDVFNIFSDGDLLVVERGVEVIAAYRVRELLASGKKSAFGADANKVLGSAQQVDILAQNAKEVESAYKALRANADEYHNNRTGFMNARLKAGRHPDTDPSFWDGYVETERIDLRQFEPFIPRKWYKSPDAHIVIAFAVISSACVALFLILRRRARRRAMPKHSPDA